MRTKRYILPLMLLGLWHIGIGQEIVGLNLPSDLCAGSNRNIVFGYNAQRNVRIYKPVASLGHSDRIFLPDGKNCQGTGCSYKSYVTFSDFPSTAVVNSVQDIKYVRLKIEHSFIGDIYINITCPNGQKADLMKKNNSGDNSDCASSIPSSSWGWHSGNNTGGSTFLGNANDEEAYGSGWGYSSGYCDSSAAGNEPGEGWNYCWSNNTTRGYQYAFGDAYIYRAANAHMIGSGWSTQRAIDSSNVSLGRNFYHPDDNFSALTGCPLNGNWYIEVMDGYSQDNGYVFEWEIALNENLTNQAQNNCQITSYEIEGPYITQGANDSTFVLSVPEDLERDTAIAYRFILHRTCGDVDTTKVIRLHPQYHIEGDTMACNQFRIGAATYNASTTIISNGHTTHNCDSTVRLNLTILHSSDTTIQAEIPENELPYMVGGVGINHSVADTLIRITNNEGCDSTIHFSLVVHPNLDTHLDTTVCQSEAPFVWHGHTFSQSDTFSYILPNRYGADSAIHLKVTVNLETDTLIELTLPESALPATFMHTDFYTNTDTLILTANAVGCDSTIHYVLHVLPTKLQVIERQICDVDTPFVWNGMHFNTTTTTRVELTATNGADSIAELRLTVNPSYDTTVADTTCDNIDYYFAGLRLTRSGHYDHTFSTHAGCDSISRLDLVVNPHYEEYFTDSVCSNVKVLFEDSLYSTAGRHIVRLSTSEGCDSLRILDLTLRDVGFGAHIKASNMIVTLQDPNVTLINTSNRAAAFQWIIEGDTLTSSPLYYTYPTAHDSVDVALVAYSLSQCTDTAKVLLTIDRSAIATPNVFTPTQDFNNTWAPALQDITELEVWIYSRQGNLVAHWTELDGHWDGTSLDGNKCPQAAYVYRLNYRTRVRPDQLQVLAGTITLVR